MFLEPHNRILIQLVNSRTVGGLSPRFQNRISLIFHSIPETNQVDAIIPLGIYESCFFTLSLGFTLSHTSYFLRRIQNGLSINQTLSTSF